MAPMVSPNCKLRMSRVLLHVTIRQERVVRSEGGRLLNNIEAGRVSCSIYVH